LLTCKSTSANDEGFVVVINQYKKIDCAATTPGGGGGASAARCKEKNLSQRSHAAKQKPGELRESNP
jgi:hypothetical protein